jgi:hypothetical protein
MNNNTIKINLTTLLNDKSSKTEILNEKAIIQENLKKIFAGEFGAIDFNNVNQLTANLQYLDLLLSNLKDLEGITTKLLDVLKNDNEFKDFNNYKLEITRFNGEYKVTYKDVKQTQKTTSNDTKQSFKLKVELKDKTIKIFDKSNYNTMFLSYLTGEELSGSYSEIIETLNNKFNLNLKHTNIFDKRNTLTRKTKEEIIAISKDKKQTEVIANFNNLVNLMKTKEIENITYMNKHNGREIAIFNVNEYYKLIDIDAVKLLDELIEETETTETTETTENDNL